MTQEQAHVMSKAVTENLRSLDFEQMSDRDILVQVLGMHDTVQRNQEEMAHDSDSLSSVLGSLRKKREKDNDYVNAIGVKEETRRKKRDETMDRKTTGRNVLFDQGEVDFIRSSSIIRLIVDKCKSGPLNDTDTE